MYWLPYSSHTSHHPSQTPCLPWISYATQNWCLIHARCSKSSLRYSIRFCGIFPSLKQNFIAYRSSKVSSRPDCIFEIHQLWQSGFSRVYSNCCCSCSFESEIKIGLPSHKMYSILNIQGSTTTLNACTKMSGNLLNYTTYTKWIYFMCPWCNGYRPRKWTRRHKFKSWTRLIAFHIALIPLGKVWIQLFSLQLWVNSRAD